MRLKSVWISEYKNLKDFTLTFDGSSFIDVFVGKNGSGKSNFFEALIEIFRHLDQLGSADNYIAFDYTLRYEIAGSINELEWAKGKLRINSSADRKTLGKTPFPDNILIYYSGHNTTVSSLVGKYELAFSKNLKDAMVSDTRRFIGVGKEYKSLFLAVMLVLSTNNPAKQFVLNSLGIETLGLVRPGTKDLSEAVLRVTLKRPDYAIGKNLFDIVNNDESDKYWKAEGITKDFLLELENYYWDNPENIAISDGFLFSEDQYVLNISLEKIQHKHQSSIQSLFRQFDNLKTLGMLQSISVPLKLKSGAFGDIDQFSDGQFQMVYIYAIMELFKDRNCITLLDEPDSFLHPEWQFEFLNQVQTITNNTSTQNHVLLSSHSAATITKYRNSHLRMFEFDGPTVVVNQVPKAEIISSLSGGKIAFSEAEAQLNIRHVLRNTSKPVLFTEGITDEMIIEKAWDKLYPNTDRPFEIQNAFSCSFMRVTVSDQNMYDTYPNRPVFALFDFDEAFKDWNQLGKDFETDPSKCLVKKRKDIESYAILLPISDAHPLKHQVINPRTGCNFGMSSLFTIEHMFYTAPQLSSYFIVDDARTDSFIKFVHNDKKVEFAEKVTLQLHDVVSFEFFKPIFEFIKSKCPSTGSSS